jgi:hypothetical protein
MKRQLWTVSRQVVSHPAARRRWDRAYQLLLQLDTGLDPASLDCALQGLAEESRHADSRLRSGLDSTPGSVPDD